jgi:hypothetical protein
MGVYSAMTQLVLHPAYLQIEDRLDAIGQKYRGQQILRGTILWTATAIVCSWVASLAAHFIGARTFWLWCILAVWAGIVFITGLMWILRALLFRPAAVAIARLLETRVAGLHNGLTNSLLLAQAGDLQDSPWLGPIFEEIEGTLTRRPIGDAVRWSELRPLAVRAAMVCLPLIVVTFCFPSAFAHGWEQMVHPAVFVPRTGAMQILDVTPGDVTLVRGQSLEISVRAEGPGTPEARLIFDNSDAPVTLSAARVEGNLRYSYRVEHLDQSLKYRVEVGTSQSRWFTANVVSQIKLVRLTVKVTPPVEKGKGESVLTIAGARGGSTPISAPEGSRINLSASLDVASNGAMLELGETSPTAMTGNLARTSFTGSFTITQDTPVAFLLTDGTGQIVAKLPEEQLIVHCIPNAAPVISAQKPAQDSVAGESDEKLRAVLLGMLKKQEDLYQRTVSGSMKNVGAGQIELRGQMQKTAETFSFGESNEIVQKTLLVLVQNPAKEAVELCASLGDSKELPERLQIPQRRIISTLQSLLALLKDSASPASQPAGREGGQLMSKADAFKKLDDGLKQYMKEQQRILDQSAGLAKKPVDNFDEKDKKLLSELLQQEDKLDAFMQGKIADFSMLAEQDMSNASLLKDLMSVYSEVTMARDALKQQAMEIAVPAEEGGLEGAKELSTNIEKWLTDAPDRQKWTQEEMPTKTDTPMAELPTELDDMVGKLLEQQEDLFDEVEDMNANIADSIDKGAGWDAVDGPIANISAKGVTGNILPNNNEMNGRSGEGRSGQSQGEFVGDSAVGKGGRNTPTRLDPTAFQKGQITDTSHDPVGGATGGGKISGSGAAGLEGPVPPAIQQQMKRLATKQAEIRNSAERLNLQYQLGRYDNFKLLESIALMRRVESDLNANQYQTALRRRDILLDSIDTSHLLLSGRIHVEQDTTPTTSLKTQQELNDAMKGEIPAAWSEAVKIYYEKLAAE